MKAQLVVFILLAAAAALLQTVNTGAQATNPPYLSQFPAPSRLKAEIKGTDPIDTSARVMGALEQLMDIIKKLAGPRYFNNDFTPDEVRLIGRYADALEPLQYKVNAPPAQDQPRWLKLRAFYEKDTGFRDELLNKFFPPEFRTFYQSAVAKQAAPPSTNRPAAGTASLTVASGVSSKPGVPNPLGGGAVVLLKGGTAPDLRQPQGVAQMKSRAAAEGRTDDSGKVTFSGLAPGEYYVVLIALKIKTPLTFGTPALVKSGSNTATIDQRHVGLGMNLSPTERATVASVLREAGGYETCKPTDILTDPDCVNRAMEQQKLEAVCPVKYTGPPVKPGVANASLSVIGMGYVYTYTERDRKTGVVTTEREVERGNFINTTLYLLDKDAEEVLAEAGVSPGLLGELLPGALPASRIMSFDMLDVEDVMFPSPGTRKELNCVMDGIKSHAVATIRTDANARGAFPSVPAGTYYVFGRFYRGGKRPAGGMFWNYPIELKPGRNVLQLSVDKAILK